jgi:hypothetical protein
MTPPTTNDTRDVVYAIARRLGETERTPINTIWRIVRRLGPEATIGWVERAEAIEAAGGMTLPDGKRRTLGGIFFRIVKDGVNSRDRAAIFLVGQQQRPGGVRSPSASTAQPATSTGAEPQDTEPQDIEIPNATGEVRTVKITVIGRPGRIVRDPRGFVTVAMQQTKVPALPKGVPAPPVAPTSYAVYIGQKQWNKVAEALQDPEDVLIVEGFPTATPEGISVYATNTTTKKLQEAQRAAQPPRT